MNVFQRYHLSKSLSLGEMPIFRLNVVPNSFVGRIETINTSPRLQLL